MLAILKKLIFGAVETIKSTDQERSIGVLAPLVENTKLNISSNRHKKLIITRNIVLLRPEVVHR